MARDRETGRRTAEATRRGIRQMGARMAERLGLRPGSPEQVARRAGRDLPRRLHREAATLSQADQMLDHPKLRAFVDQAGVRRAQGRLRRYLDRRDPARERTDRRLRWLAAAVFNLLLFFALMVGWLAATGRIGPNAGG